MLKRNRGKLGGNGNARGGEHVGNFRRKKKKPSHIKRMKMLEELVRGKGQMKEEKVEEVKVEEKGKV